MAKLTHGYPVVKYFPSRQLLTSFLGLDKKAKTVVLFLHFGYWRIFEFMYFTFLPFYYLLSRVTLKASVTRATRFILYSSLTAILLWTANLTSRPYNATFMVMTAHRSALWSHRTRKKSTFHQKIV